MNQDRGIPVQRRRSYASPPPPRLLASLLFVLLSVGLAPQAWATSITPAVIYEGETLTFTFDVSGTPAIGSGSQLIDYSGTATKTTDYVVKNPSKSAIVSTAGEHLPDKRGVSYIDGVLFSADDPGLTFEIGAKADSYKEGDETINFSHEFGTATVTLKDGPRPSRARHGTPPVASIDAAATSADEDAGTVDVRVNLRPAPASAVTLAYTVGGTATAGSGGDFTIAGSGSMTELLSNVVYGRLEFSGLPAGFPFVHPVDEPHVGNHVRQVTQAA